MKIVISEADRQNARAIALKNIARYFGVPGWEYKQNSDLKREIEALEDDNAQSLVPLLDDYFSAYDNWFEFYQHRRTKERQQQREYELSAEEQEQLQGLILKREEALKKLQGRFDDIQLANYNKHQLGGDIQGKINNQE